MIFLFILAFSLLPICAMEPNEQEPLLEAVNSDDIAELQEIVIDNNQNLPTAIWDNSRRYYDAESKKIATLKACKNCLTSTALSSGAFIAGIGGTIFIGYSFAYGFANLLDILAEGSHSLSWDWYASLKWVVGGGTGAISAIMIPLIIIMRAGEIYDARVEQNPFELSDEERSDNNKKPSISLDLIQAADETKQYYFSKHTIKSLIDHKPPLWMIRRKIIPADRILDNVMQRITIRMGNASPLRIEYYKVAFQLNKLLKEELGKDVVQYLHQFFSNKNILHHLLANYHPALWSLDYTYLTEKECLLLLNGLKIDPIKTYLAYCNTSILAENGWGAFSPSEKYPIRCHTKFFDQESIPQDAAPIYAAPDIGITPTLYLPYHPDLARYYKFEDDPYYAAEYEKPSHEKIRKLLILRHKILDQSSTAHQFPAQALNNNNI